MYNYIYKMLRDAGMFLKGQRFRGAAGKIRLNGLITTKKSDLQKGRDELGPPCSGTPEDASPIS